MKDAARRAEHGSTAAVTCATAKSSLDTPVNGHISAKNGPIFHSVKTNLKGEISSL